MHSKLITVSSVYILLYYNTNVYPRFHKHCLCLTFQILGILDQSSFQKHIHPVQKYIAWIIIDIIELPHRCFIFTECNLNMISGVSWEIWHRMATCHTQEVPLKPCYGVVLFDGISSVAGHTPCCRMTPVEHICLMPYRWEYSVKRGIAGCHFGK